MIRNKDKIKELLTRGVEEVIGKEYLEKKLKEGKLLRIKLGIDPTSSNIHLGRSIPLLKLRDFQELGHKVVLIIGDFTGVIGDTSDKESERPMLTNQEIKKNMQNYIFQAGKIVDIDKCEIRYNSDWLKKMKYSEIGEQANIFSLNEFISRDNIKKRLNSGKRVSLRELLYPLMQGYDSVMVDADIEIGGTDQKFNLLAGRELQRYYGKSAQNIIMNPIIEGLDGRKMSSSWGNTVNLLDSPNEMYGKIMSLRDEYIIDYFVLVTRVDLKTIGNYKRLLKSKPKELKMNLAFELVRFYHSESDARNAEEYFVSTFTKKEIPTDIDEFKPASYNVVDFLVESNLAPSRTEAKRLINQRSVKVDGIYIDSLEYGLLSGNIVQKGKLRFIKII